MGDAAARPERRSVVRYTQVAGLAIALIVAGSYISLPIPGSPVPVVLQNMFVLFTGLILNPAWATGAIALYLVMGALGLPVLAAGAGGMAHFVGPTGGYLLGYLVAAPLVALIVVSGNRSQPHALAAHRARLPVQIAAVLAGTLVVYLPGLAWLSQTLQTDLGATLLFGFVPFIVGDLFKAIALVAVLRGLPTRVWRALS